MLGLVPAGRPSAWCHLEATSCLASCVVWVPESNALTLLPCNVSGFGADIQNHSFLYFLCDCVPLAICCLRDSA